MQAVREAKALESENALNRRQSVKAAVIAADKAKKEVNPSFLPIFNASERVV